MNAAMIVECPSLIECDAIRLSWSQVPTACERSVVASDGVSRGIVVIPSDGGSILYRQSGRIESDVLHLHRVASRGR